MTPEIAAILVLIVVGSLVFVIDVWHGLKATGLKYVWRWLKAPGLKNKAIWFAKLFLIPIVLIVGIRWFIQQGGSIGAILVLALAGALILVRLLIWERYVRQQSPEVAEVEEGTTIWDIVKVVIVPAAISVGLLWLNVAQANRQDRIEQTRQAENNAATGTSQAVLSTEVSSTSKAETEVAEHTSTAETVVAERTNTAETVAAASQRTAQTAEAISTSGAETAVAASEGTAQAKIEETRRAAQSTVEAGRAQENALQTYLDRMSELLIDDDLRSTDKVEVRDVARAQTLTVLQRLNGERKGTLIGFLSEAELITSDTITRDVVIPLTGADLSFANLGEVDMRGAVLSEADLSEADLSGADLRFANLSEANLHQANLSEADLRFANLSEANLHQANLSEAVLIFAYLSRADLSSADLGGASLGWAYLRRADLRLANMKQAYLIQADLSEANLSKASLRLAKYNGSTIWPAGFYPEEAGAILVESGSPRVTRPIAPYPINEDLWDQIVDIIVEQLGVDANEITVDAKFRDDLGADDLDLAEFELAFEDIFNIEIPDEEAQKITTVGEAYGYILRYGAR